MDVCALRKVYNSQNFSEDKPFSCENKTFMHLYHHQFLFLRIVQTKGIICRFQSGNMLWL